MDWKTLADDKTIEKTAKALASHGIEAIIAENREDAKAKALALIPDGSEVNCMSSTTLEETGILKDIDEGGRYQSVRKRVMSIADKGARDAARKAASSCQFAIGSVHAVSEDGEVVVVSQSGSQLAPYAFSARNVIWVVGAQKIVKDIESAHRRIGEYVVPLEDARVRKAYGFGTSLNKTLIINKEVVPGRIRMIIVKERLGF
jgi:L-lactate utilization protein LutB